MILPQDWIIVDAETAAALEVELHRELPTSHQLLGRQVRAVARRTRCDDVLFCAASNDAPLYLVHLTWSVETDPKWPSTIVYDNIDDFLERWPREELEDEPATTPVSPRTGPSGQ